MTPDQATSFAAGCLKGKLLPFLEAHLGYGKVPAVADFKSTDPDVADQCERLLDIMDEALRALWEIHRSRPRQKKIDFEEKKGFAPDVEVRDEKGDWKPAEPRGMKPGAPPPGLEPKRRGRPRKARV